jgi:nucleoside-diphosphate-sugar epimerase
MKILITGIQGFVGSNLVETLKLDNIIYGLDIILTPKDGVVQIFSWKDLDNIPDVDVIIHLAGKAHDTKNKSKAQVYFEINTDLTKKVFDYFLKSNAKKFIFFSSVKAVADKVDGDILTEYVIPNPKGPYGESKVKAEEYILSKQTDKFVYIFRPCMIHGRGNKGNLNLLYHFVEKGIPWPLGAFCNKRSFTSIDNLSFIIDATIRNNINSGIYNIADDEAISTNRLIELIGGTIGKKIRIFKINKIAIKLLSGVCGFLHLPLNRDRLNKLTENYIVSNSKIKQALNIEELPIRAEDGLIKTIESFDNKTK